MIKMKDIACYGIGFEAPKKEMKTLEDPENRERMRKLLFIGKVSDEPVPYGPRLFGVETSSDADRWYDEMLIAMRHGRSLPVYIPQALLVALDKGKSSKEDYDWMRDKYFRPWMRIRNCLLSELKQKIHGFDVCDLDQRFQEELTALKAKQDAVLTVLGDTKISVPGKAENNTQEYRFGMVTE